MRKRNTCIKSFISAFFRRRLFGENELNCLGHLPEKLKTELALHVHLETLKKVKIATKATSLLHKYLKLSLNNIFEYN